MKLILAFLLLLPFGAQAKNCATDTSLINKGWLVHSSSQFDSISKEVLKKFSDQKEDYVFDTKGPIYADTLQTVVELVSYDNLKTPRDLMFGDIVFIQTRIQKELIELRWFDGTQKNVVYNPQLAECSENIPIMAENTLF